MANKGAKKRKEENEKHMKYLRYLILVSNVIYITIRLVIFRSSVSWKHFMGFLFTSGVYKFSYGQLSGMATPEYDMSTGGQWNLIDGGLDMSSGGLCGYIHDILYITSFVQISSVISDKFWYAYLLIPAFASYKLWQLILYPYIFQSSEEPVTEKGKRRKQRLDGRVGTPKFSRLRSN